MKIYETLNEDRILKNLLQKSEHLMYRYYAPKYVPYKKLADFHYTILFKNKKKYILEENDNTLIYLTPTFLAWDTEQLGLRVGKLDFVKSVRRQNISEEMLAHFIETVLKKIQAELKLEYIITRIKASDVALSMALEINGFRIIDGILTFMRDLNQAPPVEENINKNLIVEFGCQDRVEEIIKLAEKMYIYDRFHNDPLIPKERADKLHGVWLDNSCKKRVVDEVIIGVLNGKLAGFVTCKLHRKLEEITGLKVGTIVLVGTSPEFRGQSVAYTLTIESLKWFKRKGIRFVEVGTQISNIPASRLYEKAGFKLINTSLTFRRRVNYE